MAGDSMIKARVVIDDRDDQNNKTPKRTARNGFVIFFNGQRVGFRRDLDDAVTTAREFVERYGSVLL